MLTRFLPGCALEKKYNEGRRYSSALIRGRKVITDDFSPAAVEFGLVGQGQIFVR